MVTVAAMTHVLGLEEWSASCSPFAISIVSAALALPVISAVVDGMTVRWWERRQLAEAVGHD